MDNEKENSNGEKFLSSDNQKEKLTLTLSTFKHYKKNLLENHKYNNQKIKEEKEKIRKEIKELREQIKRLKPLKKITATQEGYKYYIDREKEFALKMDYILIQNKDTLKLNFGLDLK